jgi:hypothetical protein
MLIAAGANVNARLSSGITVLMYACGEYDNASVIDILIKSGADVHAKARDGGTALHDAALWGNIGAAKLLIAAGADVNAKGHSGTTPIDFAKDARKNSKEIIQLLLGAGANANGRFYPIIKRLNAAKPPHSFREFKKDVEVLAANITGFINYNDSLEDADNYLRFYLDKYLPNFPESLQDTGKFDGIWITGSNDEKIRIWGWDTRLGGSMPNLYNIIEYRTSKGISIYDEEENAHEGDLGNEWYNSISAVTRDDGTTFYIFVSTGKGDSRTWGQAVSALVIKDTSLEYQKLFLKDKDTTESLDYQGPDPMIYHNSEHIKIEDNGRRILIPVLGPNDDPTPDFDRYEFDGKYYKLVGRSQK